MELLGESWSSTFSFEQAWPELLLTGLGHRHGRSNLRDKEPVGQRLDWPEVAVGFVEVYHLLPGSVFVPLFSERTGLRSIFNEKGEHFLNEEITRSSSSITTEQGGVMSAVPALGKSAVGCL